MFAYVLLIGHYISDFFLQSSNMAESKIVNKKYLFIHCGIYTFLFAIINFCCLNHPAAIKSFLIISTTHFVFDYLRCKFDKKFNKPKQKFISFILDQCAHIGVIIGVYNLLQLNKSLSDFYNEVSTYVYFSRIVYCVFLCVLLMQPTAVFVKKFLTMLFEPNSVTLVNDRANEREIANSVLSGNKTTVESSNKNEQSSQNEPHTSTVNITTVHQNIGSTIGILERVITAILLLCNQYAAIGLVLTAKSIARFKQLEQQDFAEKYLIGTLTSLSIALVATLIIKSLM